MGGVYVPDLVEAKSPLGLAVLARIACSVREDWLCGRWADESAEIRTVICMYWALNREYGTV